MSLTSSKGYTSHFRGAHAPSAYYQVLTGDFGVHQPSLPSILDTWDYCFIVPNSSGQWQVQKSVKYMRPDGTTETEGVVLTSMDCVNPIYPGTSQTITGFALYSADTVPSIFCNMNGYLYQATNTSPGTTASTFIGGGAFNQTKGQTTTDGTVTWTSCGKSTLVVARFANVDAAASPPSTLTPVAQEYDIWLA